MPSNRHGTALPSPATQVELVVGAVLREAAREATAQGADAHSVELVRKTIGQCRELLASPPTFLVSGRMKAGKSTLINALVRQRIAETAILECTNATTIYTNGAPDRIEDVVLPARVAGRAAPQQSSVRGSQEPRRVAKVHYIPSQALAAASYIDTPGLGTIDAANRRVIDDLHKLSRVPWSLVGGGIDGVIYVFDSALRDDERAHLSSLGFPPLASVGVLSRADDYGAGAFGSTDPIAAARVRAAQLSAEYSSVFSTVVAVSGLLAESVETGVINEQLAAELGALRPLGREVLMHELETDHPTEVDATSRQRLLRALGAYGVLNGRDAAAAGAVSLKAFLSQASGIADLTAAVKADVGFIVLLGRAGQVYEKLRELSLSTPGTWLLDLWDRTVPASLRLAVELYSLIRQAPGTRTSAQALALAERVLKLAGHRLAVTRSIIAGAQPPAGARLTVAEVADLAEIHSAASEKLLHLVSPLEEKILSSVQSLVAVLSS